MGWWEKNLEDGWKGTKLQFFWRFIDDLLFYMAWYKTGTCDFISFANSLFPRIKVTAEFNFTTRSINFFFFFKLLLEKHNVNIFIKKSQG